jgi:hypothetical protein
MLEASNGEAEASQGGGAKNPHFVIANFFMPEAI